MWALVLVPFMALAVFVYDVFIGIVNVPVTIFGLIYVAVEKLFELM